MMSISALNNLKIEFQNTAWRLLFHEGRVLVEANQDGITFAPEYAMRQRIPQQLPNNLISRVVLGWSDHDLAWHLGILISQDVADWRGSRWCALAKWPELETPEAREASNALAQILGRRLKIVPPRNVEFGAPANVTVPQPAPEPIPEKVPVEKDFELPSLPLKVGQDWRFESRAGGYQFIRQRNWVISKWMSFAWYAFWAVVFITLSVASLTVELALPNSGIIFPNPEVLPYIGIVAGLFITILALNVLIEIFSKPNRIVIDSAQHSIRVMRNKVEKWRLKSVDIDSLYVSQIINKRIRKTTVEYAELNVYTTRGEFKRLLSTDDEIPYDKDDLPEQDAVVPLNETKAPLQSSAIYTARALEIPIWYDQRT